MNEKCEKCKKYEQCIEKEYQQAFIEEVFSDPKLDLIKSMVIRCSFSEWPEQLAIVFRGGYVLQIWKDIAYDIENKKVGTAYRWSLYNDVIQPKKEEENCYNIVGKAISTVCDCGILEVSADIEAIELARTIVEQTLTKICMERGII